jgi:hypothetical protein
LFGVFGVMWSDVKGRYMWWIVMWSDVQGRYMWWIVMWSDVHGRYMLWTVVWSDVHGRYMLWTVMWSDVHGRYMWWNVMWSDVHGRYMWWNVIQIVERWYNPYSKVLHTLYHGLMPNTADYFRHVLLDDLLPRSLIYSWAKQASFLSIRELPSGCVYCSRCPTTSSPTL